MSAHSWGSLCVCVCVRLCVLACWSFCIGVQDAWLCAWENVSKAAKKITFHFIQIQNFLLFSLSACVCVCCECVCVWCACVCCCECVCV